ncbi:hypothetical protein MMC25_002187 [Agyrium rufum]|nr:hypothetical protein [Agyrium rufum]
MPGNIDDAAMVVKHDPALAEPTDMKHELGDGLHATEVVPIYEGKARRQSVYVDHPNAPTQEELHTLRRIGDKIPWNVYTVAFIECCERFSYYGTSAVYTNFIQQPRASRTGAGFGGQSGALGLGQRASTGIGTFNQFWIYCVPLLGAYIADGHWGRYKTICVSVAIAIIGHIILTVSAIPSVLDNKNGAVACFIIGVIVLGFGTGGFKPNISPLVAEQLPVTNMEVQTLPSGERVVRDPAITSSRVYHYFYLFINIGALVGQIGMVYAEKYVGFWLSYLLPTLIFLTCPLVLWYGNSRYKKSPPQGSVFSKAFHILFHASKGRWSINPIKTWKLHSDGTFWENAKPSRIPVGQRPSWMTFDDQWVDEVSRGFAACSVFLYLPLYWLTYNQLNNNLTSQAAVMSLHGLPNDIVNNLDPLTLVILIPIFDVFIYPGLRKYKINFSPVKKIACGFFLGSAAMVWAAVIQAYIYKDSECGKYASGYLPNTPAGSDPVPCSPVSINVWAQTGSYVLIAISEIFASITSLEYGFSKAPRNMRSMVFAFALFMSALSAALGEAFVALSADPLLVWNYGVFAVISFVGGCIFWIQFRQLDRDEDILNQLPEGHVQTHKDVEDNISEEGPAPREIPIDDEKKI